MNKYLHVSKLSYQLRTLVDVVRDVASGCKARQSAIACMFNNKIRCRLISAVSAVEAVCGSAVFCGEMVGVYGFSTLEFACLWYSALFGQVLYGDECN